MNRIDIIQAFIDQKKTQKPVTYLEIGVLAGDAFFRVKARYKIGVDPNFTFTKGKQVRYCLKNPTNIFNKYFELESDPFFEQKDNLLSQRGLDVVFVDGLHTYSQSLADVKNSLRFLNDEGVIILHDCNPLSETAAYQASSIQEVQNLNLPGFDGIWNGDVWKTIAYLRSIRQDLHIFVLDCDSGVGVITKGKPESMLGYNQSDVKRMTYKEFAESRKSILNLKDTGFLELFMGGRNE